MQETYFPYFSENPPKRETGIPTEHYDMFVNFVHQFIPPDVLEEFGLNLPSHPNGKVRRNECSEGLSYTINDSTYTLLSGTFPGTNHSLELQWQVDLTDRAQWKYYPREDSPGYVILPDSSGTVKCVINRPVWADDPLDIAAFEKMHGYPFLQEQKNSARFLLSALPLPHNGKKTKNIPLRIYQPNPFTTEWFPDPIPTSRPIFSIPRAESEISHLATYSRLAQTQFLPRLIQTLQENEKCDHIDILIQYYQGPESRYTLQRLGEWIHTLQQYNEPFDDPNKSLPIFGAATQIFTNLALFYNFPAFYRGKNIPFVMNTEVSKTIAHLFQKEVLLPDLHGALKAVYRYFNFISDPSRHHFLHPQGLECEKAYTCFHGSLNEHADALGFPPASTRHFDYIFELRNRILPRVLMHQITPKTALYSLVTTPEKLSLICPENQHTGVYGKEATQIILAAFNSATSLEELTGYIKQIKATTFSLLSQRQTSLWEWLDQDGALSQPLQRLTSALGYE